MEVKAVKGVVCISALCNATHTQQRSIPCVARRRFPFTLRDMSCVLHC